MTLRGVTVLLVVVAGRALAHNVPVDPSVVTCSRIAFVDPATDATLLEVAGAAPFRTTYDRTASTVLWCEADAAFPQNRCAAAVTARAVQDDGGAPWGTLTFPRVFVHRFDTARDLTPTGPVALTIEPTVGSPSVISVSPTTGLVSVGATVAGGQPIDDAGAFTLVAAADVASLGVGTLPALLVMDCQADPVPDADQFAAPGRLGHLKGKVRGGVLRLRGQFRPGSDAPLAFDAAPTLIDLRVGETILATVQLAGGLVASGRRFVGSDGGGTSVTLKLVQRKPTPVYALAVQTALVGSPPATRPLQVDATFLVGQRLARGRGIVHAKSGG